MDWQTIFVAIISAAGAGVVPYITMRHKLIEQKRQLEADQALAREQQSALQAERELARRERMEAEMSAIRAELRDEIRELRTRLTEANAEIMDLRRRLVECESKHGSQLEESAVLRGEVASLRAASGMPATDRRHYHPQASPPPHDLPESKNPHQASSEGAWRGQ